MPSRDGIVLALSGEHTAHVHDAVDAVVVIDLHGILPIRKFQGFGGVQHDDGECGPRQHVDGLEGG